jgi:hypothetical protein
MGVGEGVNDGDVDEVPFTLEGDKEVRSLLIVAKALWPQLCEASRTLDMIP